MSLHLFIINPELFQNTDLMSQTTLTCCSVLDKTLTAVYFSQVTLVDSGISVSHQLDGEDETAVIVILPVAKRPWKPGKQWGEIF